MAEKNIKVGKGTGFMKAQLYVGPYGGLYAKVNGRLYRLQQVPSQRGMKVRKARK